MPEPLIILLANGFFLSFILLVLLIILAYRRNGLRKKGTRKIKEDIKKIKEQIISEK